MVVFEPFQESDREIQGADALLFFQRSFFAKYFREALFKFFCIQASLQLRTPALWRRPRSRLGT
jgi:hypothetical protein